MWKFIGCGNKQLSEVETGIFLGSSLSFLFEQTLQSPKPCCPYLIWRMCLCVAIDKDNVEIVVVGFKQVVNESWWASKGENLQDCVMTGFLIAGH